MKNLILVLFASVFVFYACGTPAPSTTIPSDSIMKSGKPAPDSPAIDSASH